MEKDTEKKIAQLQLIEQNLQSSMMQKQTFQAQLLEIENALNELTKVKEAYKIIGQVMIASDKDKLKTELTEKKEIIELRLKSLDKQESKLKEQASSLREEVLKELKQKE